MSDIAQTHIAVLHERWLEAFRSGAKRAELRIGKRRPMAAKAKPGDIVHFRHVGGPCMLTMTVERVLDLGYCDRRTIADLRERYGRALGLKAGEPIDYLDRHPGGYVVLVFLHSVRPSRRRQCPKYQPWSIVAPE